MLVKSIAAAGGCAARDNAAPRESANSCAKIFSAARIGEANRLSFGAKMTNPYDLDRFVSAQARSYDTALGEIRRGAKRTHWMWFIFPQIAGLGRSDMARRFAIQSLDEAKAYLSHPMLGPRLRECVAALQDLTGGTARSVFGEIDAAKLRSSLTLFEEAGAGALFTAAIARWFDGVPDAATVEILKGRSWAARNG